MFSRFQQLNRIVQAIGGCFVPMMNAFGVLLLVTMMYAAVPLTPHPSPLTPHSSPLTPHPSPPTPNGFSVLLPSRSPEPSLTHVPQKRRPLERDCSAGLILLPANSITLSRKRL